MVNETAGKSIDEIEEMIAKKLESLEFKAHLTTTFFNAREAVRLPCETGKPLAEYYHSTDPFLAIRAMRAKKRSGLTTKSRIVRYRDAENKVDARHQGTTVGGRRLVRDSDSCFKSRIDHSLPARNSGGRSRRAHFPGVPRECSRCSRMPWKREDHISS